ncbi:MAG: hypothetical protein V4564_05890 [Pseudomonadota bacterium]|uniref:hypothetical protein n=1 Tax=Sphingomonas sp. ERG5 TaxID=1381597 RepID=UPI00054C5584|nr:hypothetical protein [Sphingomonas sp. ERG5]
MTDQRWMLRNIARRPIELHGGAAVTIVPADSTIEVAVIDERHAALIDRGLMTVHPAPATSIATPAPAPRKGKGPVNKTPVKKPPVKQQPAGKTPTKTSRRKGEGA